MLTTEEDPCTVEKVNISCGSVCTLSQTFSVMPNLELGLLQDNGDPFRQCQRSMLPYRQGSRLHAAPAPSQQRIAASPSEHSSPKHYRT